MEGAVHNKTSLNGDKFLGRIGDEEKPGSYGHKYTALEDRIVKNDKVENHGKILFDMLRYYRKDGLSICGVKALFGRINRESLPWKNQEGDTCMHLVAKNGDDDFLKELLKVSEYEHREICNEIILVSSRKQSKQK
eukprot:TRINITY_DN1898_c0_g1_i1.p1 TRINITY_DN1898_c0_g1~~TRINITY_DN1898_c0_g1_i1.p1  ORF type:complete len:136 (-),score=17.81 TRINITY_DN1898_c0_g1_i1:15-422(-)